MASSSNMSPSHNKHICATPNTANRNIRLRYRISPFSPLFLALSRKYIAPAPKRKEKIGKNFSEAKNSIKKFTFLSIGLSAFNKSNLSTKPISGKLTIRMPSKANPRKISSSIILFFFPILQARLPDGQVNFELSWLTVDLIYCG